MFNNDTLWLPTVLDVCCILAKMKFTAQITKTQVTWNIAQGFCWQPASELQFFMHRQINSISCQQAVVLEKVVTSVLIHTLNGR